MANEPKTEEPHSKLFTCALEPGKMSELGESLSLDYSLEELQTQSLPRSNAWHLSNNDMLLGAGGAAANSSKACAKAGVYFGQLTFRS